MCNFLLNQTPLGLQTFLLEFFIGLEALTFPYHDLTTPSNFPVRNLRKDTKTLKICSKLKIETPGR